jgi:hypothetical protein
MRMTSSHGPSFIELDASDHGEWCRHIPTVVPAELMEKTRPLRLSSRCTSAISAETDALPVPIGTKQKSAIHADGVWSSPRLTVSLGGGGSMSSIESVMIEGTLHSLLTLLLLWWRLIRSMVMTRIFYDELPQIRRRFHSSSKHRTFTSSTSSILLPGFRREVVRVAFDTMAIAS